MSPSSMTSMCQQPKLESEEVRLEDAVAVKLRGLVIMCETVDEIDEVRRT